MKTDRIFTMTRMLMERKSISVQELAEYFSVSKRTIYRDADSLSANGMPIIAVHGRKGYIAIQDEYFTKKRRQKNEQDKMIMAIQGSKPLQDRFSKDYEILSREAWLEIDFSEWEQSELESVNTIKNSILKGKSVSFIYSDDKQNKSECTVKPIKLIFKKYNWFLYGFYKEIKDFYYFEFKGIEQLLSLNKSIRTNVPVKK